MPNDLVLRAVSSAEPTRAAPRAADQAVTAPIPAAIAPVTPNPRLRLDGSLGMVVLEFRGTGGEVANTIPTPRAIAAYRAAALTDAPVPIGVQPRLAGSTTAPSESAPVPAPAPMPAAASRPATAAPAAS
jgi:hypothetical protein